MESIKSVSTERDKKNKNTTVIKIMLLRREWQKGRPLEDRVHKPWEGIHRGTVGEKASIKEHQPVNRRQVCGQDWNPNAEFV